MRLLSLNARRIGVLMFSLCALALMTSASMPAEKQVRRQAFVGAAV